jgi:hypothetical protein
MSLAFYKGTCGGVWDKAIDIWTRGEYSHVELWLDGPVHRARCYSSSPRDGGIRYSIIDLDSGKWDAIALPFTEMDRWIIERHISDLGHKKYDWLGILGFVLPWGEHDDKDRFCSEICLDLIQTRGYLMQYKAWEVSPVKLAAIATPLWGAPVAIPVAASELRAA